MIPANRILVAQMPNVQMASVTVVRITKVILTTDVVLSVRFRQIAPVTRLVYVIVVLILVPEHAVQMLSVKS